MHEDFDAQIVLFKNKTTVPGLKKFQPSLFLEFTDRAELFEEPTHFLDERYVRSGKTPSKHTWLAAAHSLKNWFEWLIAIQRPWRQATHIDWLEFRDAYLGAV